MNVQILKRICQSLALTFFLAAFAGSVMAADVAVGTVLSKANLASLESQTFQGIKVGDMLTDTMKMWINDYDLKIKLGNTSELKFDAAYLAANKKYVGQAKLDPGTKTVSNYTAGIPFADIDLKDPEAGYKLTWNHYYANPIMGNNWIAVGAVTITEAEKGIVDNFVAMSGKIIMEGRTEGEARVGEEDEHARYLLVLTKPYDLAGLGIYTKQYNTGRVDDAWAYVKSIRRTRRVAGGKSWMDPQPKMDLLNDDNQAVNTYPLFYQDWKVLGKRWILAVVKGPDAGVEQDFSNVIEQAPPYWNPTNVTWEPREVYVVEATPPKEHPYSKKILYMDVDYPFYYQAEFYDRKGSLWRIWQQLYRPSTAGNGQPAVNFIGTQAIDLQRNRATFIGVTDLTNNPKLTPDAFSPKMLKQAGAGALDKYLKK
jgi:hypothetical protein